MNHNGFEGEREHGLSDSLVESSRVSAEQVVALVHDLIGRPYPAKGMKAHLVAMEGRGPLDCYQLVREVVRRWKGWEMPETPEAALYRARPIAEVVPWPPRLGDLLECDGAGEHPAHLAIVVDAGEGGGWAMHSTSGVGVTMVSVGVMERSKRVRRVLRLIPPAAGSRWVGA